MVTVSNLPVLNHLNNMQPYDRNALPRLSIQHKDKLWEDMRKSDVGATRQSGDEGLQVEKEGEELKYMIEKIRERKRNSGAFPADGEEKEEKKRKMVWWL